MHNQPSVSELVQAVKNFVDHSAMPELEGRAAFHARVASNVLATILRDLDQSASTALAAAFTAFARPGTDPAHLANVADLFLVFISGLVNRSVSYPDMDMSPIEEIMCDTIVAQIPTA